MSEQLLKAVIRLFALLAKVDGITKYEKTTIKDFLLDKLNEVKGIGPKAVKEIEKALK